MVREQGRRAGGLCVSVSEVFREGERRRRGFIRTQSCYIGDRLRRESLGWGKGGSRLTGNRAAAEAGESGMSAAGGLPADPAPGRRSGWRVRLKGGGEKG